VGFLAAGAASFLALITGKPRAAARIVAAMGAWALVYAAILAAVSLASREVALERGQIKKFCGVYLDCHIGVSFEGAERRGPRYGVTVRISSDARQAVLESHDLMAILVDSAGERHEKAIPSRTLGPGESFTHEVEYVLPARVRPRYLMVEGYSGPERVLIGDEDSLLHKKTKFRLDADL
jgi:hypothetical protein